MDHNKVTIGNIFLTSDGTDLGMSCRVDIPELASLRPRYRRTNVLPIEGKPVTQLFDNLIGEILTMNIFLLNKDEYDDIIELIDTTDESDGEINVTIESELGDFDLECVLESMTQPGEFDDDRIPTFTLVWRISEVNEEEEEE